MVNIWTYYQVKIDSSYRRALQNLLMTVKDQKATCANNAQVENEGMRNIKREIKKQYAFFAHFFSDGLEESNSRIISSNQTDYQFSY